MFYTYWYLNIIFFLVIFNIIFYFNTLNLDFFDIYFFNSWIFLSMFLYLIFDGFGYVLSNKKLFVIWPFLQKIYIYDII